MYKITSAPRWHLLTTVSALALLGSIGHAAADDAGKPILWLELGGQLERLQNSEQPFEPPFVSNLLNNPFTPPSKIQAPPHFSIGDEGRISFSPEGSDWVFSAGVRYGRASRRDNQHEETSPASAIGIISIPALGKYSTGPIAPVAERFATTNSHTQSTDLVLDFQAGKEVGLGMLGSHDSSTLSAGIRIAQFRSRSSVKIDSDPNFAFSYKYLTQLAGIPGYFKIPTQGWDLYSAKMDASRSFTGIGPSLKWEASATLLGHPDNGAVTFDWGVNGAVLFGRQRMKAHHETSALHGSGHHASGPLPVLYPAIPHDPARARSVTVPNIGGFAGLSLRYSNAKLSLGYRADFFFGAIDGGIDTRKEENRGFYGPFASISFGMGD